MKTTTWYDIDSNVKSKSKTVSLNAVDSFKKLVERNKIAYKALCDGQDAIFEDIVRTSRDRG